MLGYDGMVLSVHLRVLDVWINCEYVYNLTMQYNRSNTYNLELGSELPIS